jgi:hypothetical protein
MSHIPSSRIRRSVAYVVKAAERRYKRVKLKASNGCVRRAPSNDRVRMAISAPRRRRFLALVAAANGVALAIVLLVGSF